MNATSAAAESDTEGKYFVQFAQSVANLFLIHEPIILKILVRLTDHVIVESDSGFEGSEREVPMANKTEKKYLTQEELIRTFQTEDLGQLIDLVEKFRLGRVHDESTSSSQNGSFCKQ